MNFMNDTVADGEGKKEVGSFTQRLIRRRRERRCIRGQVCASLSIDMIFVCANSSMCTDCDPYTHCKNDTSVTFAWAETTPGKECT